MLRPLIASGHAVVYQDMVLLEETVGHQHPVLGCIMHNLHPLTAGCLQIVERTAKSAKKQSTDIRILGFQNFHSSVDVS